MSTHTLADLKEYVRGGVTVVQAGTCKLDVTHSLLSRRFVEIVFDLKWTIDRVKHELVQYVGTNTAFMTLTLNGHTLHDDNRTLGSYNPASLGGVLHVIDHDPTSSVTDLDDLSKVQKYVMTDQEYDKRTGTVRDFKRKQRDIINSVRSANAATPTVYTNKPTDDSSISSSSISSSSSSSASSSSSSSSSSCEVSGVLSSSVVVGVRCSVSPGDRRGVVEYVGQVVELLGPGIMWVGVKFDEPVGKHDGSVMDIRTGQIKRYFSAPNKHGAFVKPTAVTVGDFPERDPFDDEDDDTQPQQTNGEAKEKENIMEEL